MRYIILLSVLITGLLFVGCGDPGTNTNSANNSSANTNTTQTNSNSPVSVTKSAPEQTNNMAPTLTPVFREYCEAMEKKDEARIRKVYSKDTLESFASDMKDEGSKTLVEYLSADGVTTALCTIRNEVITGDSAVAEIKTAAVPNGAKIIFVKEGTEWKLTNRFPDIDAVTQTETKSNTNK